MEEKGHCKHGEFILRDGCPQCIEERRAAEESTGSAPPNPGSTTADIPATEVELPSAETALATRPGADVKVMGYYNEALELQQYATSRVIATIEDIKLATEDLSIIAKLKKAMEEKRKEYIVPLQDQVKQINETYKTLMAPVLEADKITRDKMLAFDAEQKRIRAEQEEVNRLRMEAARKEMELKGEITESVDLVEVAPEAPKKIYTNLGTAGQRDNWKYEIIDFAQLPDEYKVADTAMLNTIAKKHHDQKQIPGVRFYNEPIIAVRTR